MSSLALYRTYRPGRFADVVGQEHVTGPLMRALDNDRVHHAYLFSGPRGCGKTSSARILARSLNCEKGPTAEPCGTCQSCLDLAPNSSGSIDVIELDAATHGLVDDARDLREKAHFAPVTSRFKIYIVDEAHQLGPGAANALLKLIEEPPPHLKFIFATTAPDKILGTIRSRTHHYPFRLIPAKTLQQNLAAICEHEGVTIEPAALALVARAGAGSARDAQSVLGQLIAGAGPEGVTYDLAVALLGFTDAALLDQVVDAIAVTDAASVFTAVDRVMESGHDPRRFLTDLLERFRDLIVVRAAPDAATSGLIEAPDDEAERMSGQAARFGPADLVRLADVVDEGITAMKGATPTRLQLELVCARLLLPGADDTTAGVQARLDRLERRVASGVPTTAPSDASPQPSPQPSAAPPPRQAAPAQQAEPARQAAPTQQAEPPAPPRPAAASAESAAPASAAPATPAADDKPAARPAQQPADEPVPPPDDVREVAPAEPAVSSSAAEPLSSPPPSGGSAPSGAPAPSGGSAPSGALADVRRMWPEVLARLREIKRTPWSLISQESAVVDVADGVLTLAFRKPNLRDTFARRDDFQQNLKQALKDVLLVDLAVDAIVDPSADPAAPSGAASSAQAPRSAPPNPATEQPAAPGSDDGKGGGSTAVAGRADAAKAAARQGRPNASAAAAPAAADADFEVDPDDQNLDDNAVSQRDLLARTLGATVIDEIQHEP